MAHSGGLTIPWGFSARELFQKMAVALEPIPEMIRAVKALRTAGMEQWWFQTRSSAQVKFWSVVVIAYGNSAM